MSVKAVFDARRHEIFAELREAEARFQASRRETRIHKERLVAVRAKYSEFADLERKVYKFEYEAAEGQSIDAATSQRVSEMILACLHHRGSAGMTLAELSEMLPDIKRSTISATLYNMKARDQIEHNEKTGKYALSLEIRRHLQVRAK